MGQKRVKTIDLSKKDDKKSRKKKAERKVVKTGKESGRITDMGAVALAEMETRKKMAEKEKKPAKKAAKREKKAKKKKKPKKKRSRRYRKLRTYIDRQKLYPIKQALELLTKIANTNIDETVEVHISTRKKSLRGEIKFPYSTGKTQKVAIADKKTIEQVKNGKIDFDILIASPEMMKTVAQVAAILGPKGLMPNPKTKTITDQPEKLKKKLESGVIKYQTERKFPLIHMVIGKVSMGPVKLAKNLKALIDKIGPKNIKKATLTSTHSPGIKLEIAQPKTLKKT